MTKRHIIEGPDGKQHVIEAPDDATPDQVMEFVSQSTGGNTPHQKAPSKPYEGWGQYGKDLARVAGQGATLGTSDEIVAAVRSAFSNATYDEALDEERGSVERFRDQNPKTALATELAAGFAVPGFGAAKSVAKAASLPGKVVSGAKYGAAFGGTSGFASGEGGFENRAQRAQEGAAFGAGIGALLPAGAKAVGLGDEAAGRFASNVADNEGSAELYLADKLRQAGMDETHLVRDLHRGRDARQFAGGEADLPETIADVNPTMQRILRGIKVGGDADEVIEPFLARRQSGDIDFTKGAETGGQFGRLQEQLRLAMNVSDQELPDVIEGLTGRRKAEADRLFKAARDNSEAFDLTVPMQQASLRAMAIPDPEQRSQLGRAIAMFTQQGKYGRYPNSNLSATQFPVNDIERFHNAKVSLDDLIGEAKGNMKRLLTQFKHDLMDAVFAPGQNGGPAKNQRYAKALEQYATKSELLNAAELGKAFSNGTEQITPRMWRSMSEAEKKMVRRAWLDTESGKMNKSAGPTTDFTSSLRKPGTGDDLRLLLPPTAGRTQAGGLTNRERLGELVSREHRMSTTAQKVLGNSSTAEKAVDAIDVGRMVRTLRYIKDQGGLVNAAVNSLADTLEKLSAIKGERAKYLAQQLLNTDPMQQDMFIARIAQQYGQAQARATQETFTVWKEAFGNALSIVQGSNQPQEAQ